jgi:catechol 1,2-dioxygenase
VTTQIFDRIDPHLEDDSVFAVKESLIVDFVALQGNTRMNLTICISIHSTVRQDSGLL